MGGTNRPAQYWIMASQPADRMMMENNQGFVADLDANKLKSLTWLLCNSNMLSCIILSVPVPVEYAKKAANTCYARYKAKHLLVRLAVENSRAELSGRQLERALREIKEDFEEFKRKRMNGRWKN